MKSIVILPEKVKQHQLNLCARRAAVKCQAALAFGLLSHYLRTYDENLIADLGQSVSVLADQISRYRIEQANAAADCAAMDGGAP